MKNCKPSFDLDPRTGRWNLTAPSAGITDARTTLYLNGQWITLFQQATVKKSSMDKIVIEEQKDNGLFARMNISFPKDIPAIFIDVELKNNSRREMTLGTLHLLELGKIQLGKKSGPMKVFVDSGGGWWAGAVDIESTSPYKEQWDLLPPEDKSLVNGAMGETVGQGYHTSLGGIGALYDSVSKNTLIAAFLTFNRSSGHITWMYQKDKGLIGGWAAGNFAGFCLKPGQAIRSEKLFLGFYTDPHRGLEDYATSAGKLMKVKIPKVPPMGWCSWYAFRLKMTEDILLANAEALKKHFGSYDFSYIQADHGWQYKDITGHWTETNEKFPHGIKWLAKKLDALGYKLGLWLGFFIVLESSPLFKEHPEYMIKDSRGNPQVSPYQWAWEPHDRIYHLDPTHPGAQKFIRKTFTTLRNAGVRYWKIDFTLGISNNEPEAHYHDPRIIKGAEAYRKGLTTIMEVLKNDYVYWCSNPINLGFGLGSTSMTACDIGNPGFSQACEVEGRTENLNYFRQCATTVISRYFLHRKLVLLNPDVVEVGGACMDEEAKIRLSLVALAGGQVFLGDDLTALSDDQWDLLAKCVPPYGHAARPVDMFENTYPLSHPRIWHLPVRTKWGNWELVALFNLTEKPVEAKVDFSSLGLEKGKDYLVYEFWEKNFVGRKKNSVTMNLKPVSTRLLLIREPSSVPVVLSTDMHVTQGAVELSKVVYDKKAKVLKGTARRHAGARGNLFIWIPGRKDLIVHPLSFDKPVIKWDVEC
ncbi:MAG: alpha-galactosidase [Phycisphaerae bacterium]